LIGEQIDNLLEHIQKGPGHGQHLLIKFEEKLILDDLFCQKAYCRIIRRAVCQRPVAFIELREAFFQARALRQLTDPLFQAVAIGSRPMENI
jgi:hypothetical protein